MKNRTFTKIGAILLTTIIVVLCLASCGKSADMGHDSENMLPNDAEIGDAGSSLSKGEYVAGDDALADKSENEGEADNFEPKIIRKVTMNAETRDFNGAITEIEASITELGGYIESCNIRNANNSYRGTTVTERYADYVIRIPADSLDSFLAEAGALLNVTSTSSSADDISGEYYDIQARISVLETERQLLEKMLSEADSVDTMLTLEKRLYDVIYEIESYKTAIKVYDSKVAYSTVNLSLREVAELTDTAEDKTFWERVGTAAGESWKMTLEIGEELIIGGIYIAPFAIVVCAGLSVAAAVVLVVVLVVTKIVRNKTRKAKASE